VWAMGNLREGLLKILSLRSQSVICSRVTVLTEERHAIKWDGFYVQLYGQTQESAYIDCTRS